VPAVASVVRSLLEALPDAACAVDRTGAVAVANAGWAAAADGALPRAAAADDPVAEALPLVLRGELGGWAGTSLVATASGPRWLSRHLAPLPAVGGAVVRCDDVTDVVAQARRRLHLSRHDGLTGLPNRALLLDRLQEALARRGARAGAVAVVLLDLVGLDAEDPGPGAGDALLVAALARVRSVVAEGDLLARSGAAQLAVVREGVLDEAEARSLAEGLRAALLSGDPLDPAPGVVLPASVGVALGPPFEDAAALLAAAGTGPSRAEAARAGGVRVVSEAVQRGAERRSRLAREVRTAARRGQLRVDHQPVVDLRTGEVAGTEALLRWSHPELGDVSPAEFVPVTEETGGMGELGGWVLQTVCDCLAARGPDDTLRVAVNLSAEQLVDDSLVEDLTAELGARGLSPSRLVLEVTESAVVADREHSTRLLRRLRALGVGLSLDDFGTGWSSLVYLRDFPFDLLKIDRRFVAGLGVVDDDTAIVASVIDLGHAVGMRVVAEGVETLEQLDHLRSLGCDLAQGFLWAPAVPEDELDTVLLALPVGPLRGREADVRRSVTVREARVRARATELVRAGASLHTVAAALNADGLLTSRGTRWSASAAAHLVAALRAPT
jgi:EAL domain-containing protein (putative c-di-GMP-specific phosphodiesterase class I)/GGDEF domain-containing protein